MMLAYHEISNSSEKDVYALTAQTFRRHALIVGEYCEGVDCMTFDDGHRSNFDLALPVLEELRIRATFFITTAWINLLDSIMTWDQLRQLCRAGHMVASHTHTHPMLTSCSDRTLRNELIVSKRILEDRLGIEITSISMPGGRTDRRVLAACTAAGYERVYTSRVGECLQSREEYPLVIGRYVVTRSTSDRTLASYLAGHRGTWRRLQLESGAKRLVKCVVGDGLYQRAWRRLVRSQSFGS